MLQPLLQLHCDGPKLHTTALAAAADAAAGAEILAQRASALRQLIVL
jgi:hypothetical protein